MKKSILYALLCIALAGSLSAQITLDQTSVTYKCSPNDVEVVANFDVTNSAGRSVDVKVRREVMQNVQGTSNNFCWGTTCYPPTTDESNSAVMIAANDVESSFKGQYYPNGNAGNCIVEYCFFEPGNESNQACITVSYEASAISSVSELAETENAIMNPSPNPASGFTVFSYTLNARAQQAELVVVDITGKEIRRENMDPSANIMVMDVSDLRPGMYLYRFVVDNVTVESNRLVVAH